MDLKKIKPQFIKKSNPRIGLIALASDFMIEKDFLNIIKDIRSSQNITTIAGGGDTIAAIKKTNAENSFTYISTGGGAFLQLMSGKQLPALAALHEYA